MSGDMREAIVDVEVCQKAAAWVVRFDEFRDALGVAANLFAGPGKVAMGRPKPRAEQGDRRSGPVDLERFPRLTAG